MYPTGPKSSTDQVCIDILTEEATVYTQLNQIYPSISDYKLYCLDLCHAKAQSMKCTKMSFGPDFRKFLACDFDQEVAPWQAGTIGSR